ncbi:MAG: YraN family protein [Methyloligellaceae bacterium]
MNRRKIRKKRFSYWKGHLAEALASLYLMLKGYRILARRYKTRAGEIDIIALRGKRLAFVEVKLRSDLEKALGALTRYQEKRIIASSKYWIRKNCYYKEFNIAYDYIALVPWKKLSHFKDFYRE